MNDEKPPSADNGKNKSKRPSDSDSWSLDDVDFNLEEKTTPPPTPKKQRPTRRQKKTTPPPAPENKVKKPSRFSANTPPEPVANSLPAPREEKNITRIQLGVSPQAAAARTAKPTARRIEQMASVDLDDWEDVKIEKTPDPTREKPKTPIPEKKIEIPVTEKTEPPAPEELLPVSKEETPANEAPEQETKPTSPSPKTQLSTLEKTSIIVLAVLLLVTGIFAYRFSLSRLPDAPANMEVDFPVKGSHVLVESAKTWWKVPSEKDHVRRGTALAPEIIMRFGSSQGAIRIRFLDDTGNTMGDIFTYNVPSDGSLEITATTGFKDLGMHAAYRSTEKKPWTIQVSEAPDVNAPGDAFKPLFTTALSATRKP